jgi:hypothetical protein
MAAPVGDTSESQWQLVGKPKGGRHLAGHKVTEVENAHLDDIHALLFLREERTFISGSKDGTLKKWDLLLRPVSVIDDPEVIDYGRWITALSRVGEDHWVSGTRDGYIHFRNNEGTVLSVLEGPSQGDGGSKCKKRNSLRINCLSDLTHFGSPLRFISGRPTQFAVHTHRGLSFPKELVKTSENDWVYAVEPLREEAYLVANGGRFDLIEKERQNWVQTTLMEELPLSGGQRSFISSITLLEGGQRHLAALSIFNGIVAICDITTKQITRETNEHQGRVWTIENISPSYFASSADDGLIKLWDLRCKKSVATMRDNPEEAARVSVLLSPDEQTLISGSCPDDVGHSENKARLSLWDLRKG